MPRSRKSSALQMNMLDVTAELRTAPCVPAIRQEVEQWKQQGCPGITDTTRRLLNWWFRNDHRTPRGTSFRYYALQQAAIETMIYLYEVKQRRRIGDLLLHYAKGQKIALPARDEFARYAVKMATGSGKTKVMAMAIVWQYFNAIRESSDDYATTFLVIAPNVIVLERLMVDFAGGAIFKSDPLIPPDFQLLWDFDVYVRGDGERARSEGALYLTNIQQLYEKTETEKPTNPVLDLLGPEPPPTLQVKERFVERIARRGNCVVLNDEAHHTNDDAVVWNEVIADLHGQLHERGLTAQLDFSATPRQPDGNLFTWTIYDYPLKQAIVDAVVKRPIKGIAQGITEAQSDRASVRYEAYLVAAVERWQEYREQLDKLQKKPVLFLMLSDTESADDVAAWLRRKYSEHFEGDKLLVIHTNKSGEISKGDLENARRASREVDLGTSPVQCIVSVMMLREGWDVSNVTVVVGLRPFTAKANILPEQAIGRGLRLMFREHSGYREHVDIIGNSNFMQIVEDLEKTEGIKLDTFEFGKKKTPLKIQTIQVLTDRIAQYDLTIPILTPRLERKKDARAVIESLHLDSLHLLQALKLDTQVAPPEQFTYQGRDVISDEVMIERTYTMPDAQTSGDIVAFFAREIADSLKLPTQFSVLAPKVEQFLRDKAFGGAVDLQSKLVLQALNRPVVLHFTLKVFLRLLRPMLSEERAPVLSGELRKLSTTFPFAWSGKIVEAKKTLFDFVPCDNDFEQDFARFLEAVPDVKAFANLGNLPAKLSIEYLDSEANLRLYEPDFIGLDADGIYWILETKGREDIEVARKNLRAEQWCQDVARLTGQRWEFLLVPQKEYDKLRPGSLGELVAGLKAGGALFV
jgi:type III restriction enzyme